MQFYAAWNKNIKVIYELPWATHHWILVEEITGKSLKLRLLKRFMKFVNSMLKTKKPFLKFLLSTVAADIRSVTGPNLRSSTGVQVTPGQTIVSSIKKNVL